MSDTVLVTDAYKARISYLEQQLATATQRAETAEREREEVAGYLARTSSELTEVEKRAEAAEARLKEVVQFAFEDACKAMCVHCKNGYGYVGGDYLTHDVPTENEDDHRIYWCDATPIRNISAVKGLRGEG